MPTEQRVHFQSRLRLCFQVKSTHGILSNGTLWGKMLLSWQWRALSTLFSIFWYSTGSSWTTGKGLANLHTQHLDLLSHQCLPLKRNQENSSHRVRTQTSFLTAEVQLCCTRCFSTDDFLAPSGYQTTRRRQHTMRMTTWQQRGREFMMEGARLTSCRSETSLR